MFDIETLYPGLLGALIKVESGGNDDAVGDNGLHNKAYGALQIRRPYMDDVNRVFGSKNNPQECLGNRDLSVLTLNRYMSIYATEKRLGHYPPTAQDIARIHNGGPMGYRNSKTIMYWDKVKKFYV